MSGHYVRPLLAGVGIFAVVYVAEAVLASAGVHGPRTLFVGALLGAFAGITLHCYLRELEASQELRRRRYHENLISYLNHHIRNALQLIVNRAELDVHSVRELMDIQNAVNRIDWALREILPRVTGTTTPKSPGTPFVTTKPAEHPPQPCLGIYPRYVPENENVKRDKLGVVRPEDDQQEQTSVLRNKSA